MQVKLCPGTLWEAMLRRENSALASGSLRPIETVREEIPDAEARFIVRKVSSVRRKEEARRSEPPRDPFLPYEEALFVADVCDSHVALLNKFNVLEHHLLVVTRAYEDQESLIGRDDFDALTACMREFDSLGFYNGGKEAGASQPHKHLQLVPLPLENGADGLPIEPLFAPVRGQRGLCRIPAFGFRHAFSWIAGLDDAAGLHALYLRMMASMGLAGAGGRQAGPYNWLLTRSWMLLVPRSRERFGAISMNALGFAGSFFVRDDEQMAALRSAGPLAALAAVAVRN